jgi:hypothetical protein
LRGSFNSFFTFLLSFSSLFISLFTNKMREQQLKAVPSHNSKAFWYLAVQTLQSVTQL